VNVNESVKVLVTVFDSIDEGRYGTAAE
jgi:hypothetical protein